MFDSFALFYHRVPFLLRVLCCVAVPANGKVNESLIPVLASAYSILMKHRYNNLSSFQRLTTAVAVRGGLDERVIIFVKVLVCINDYKMLNFYS